MLLCAPTEYLSKVFSVKEAVKILADAGYKAYDFSLCGKLNPRELSDMEDYRERAAELRKYADSLGIVCRQSHAHFPSSVGVDETDKEIFNQIIRDMETASILGAEIIVVHPKQHLTYAEHIEELFEMNVEFYKSLIPYCEKFGIKVAMENMFQWNRSANCAYDSTCSRAWEFCKYMDAVDSEWIVGLLDVGHTALVDANLTEFIHALGNKRLKALHIHDNDRKSDFHTLPFTQKLDFDAITTDLAAIGYQGDFTYEADNFLTGFPKELLPDAVAFMCKVGNYLVKEIQRKRKQ